MKFGIWFENTMNWYRYPNGSAVVWDTETAAQVACDLINKYSVLIGQVRRVI